MLSGREKAHDQLLTHIAEQSTQIGGGLVTSASIVGLLRSPPEAGPALRPRGPKPECPYLGMRPFGEEDKACFFGRDREVESIVRSLRRHPFLAVIGPSGSGKSSLVAAGLVPALRESTLFGPGNWHIIHLRPQSVPLANLVKALAGNPVDPDWSASCLLAAQPGSRRLLLVVDQFEEIFTQSDEEESAAFQRALQALVEKEDCYVVLTVRADFYSQIMNSQLWSEIQAHRLELSHIDELGLRFAIARPAEQVGAFVERALVERLVADAAGDASILPFMQETLVLLWDRMEGKVLSLGTYDDLVSSVSTGEGTRARRPTVLHVAIAEHAKEVLAALSPEQQTIAQHILLGLVQFGERRSYTRRQQSVADLRASGDEPALFTDTLQHLAHLRLVTLSGEEEYEDAKVDLIHDALIDGWPTLQAWLDEHRAFGLWRERLASDIRRWQKMELDEGSLLRKRPLVEAEDWLQDRRSELNDEEIRFIEESCALRKREEDAKKRLQRRIQVGLVIGLLIACVLTSVALSQWRSSSLNAKALATEVAVRTTAEASADRQAQAARSALSEQLASQAEALLSPYPQRSLLLAVEAISVTVRKGEAPTRSAEAALRRALAHTGGRGLSGHTAPVSALAIDSESKFLATGGDDGAIGLWSFGNIDTPESLEMVDAHESPITVLAFSTDTKWLVSGAKDGTVVLWDLGALDLSTKIDLQSDRHYPISAVAISDDSRWVVAGSDNGSVTLWNSEAEGAPPTPVPLHSSHKSRITSVTFDPIGNWLLTVDSQGVAFLWGLTREKAIPSSWFPDSSELPVSVKAISPDGSWLVVSMNDDDLGLVRTFSQDSVVESTVLMKHSGDAPQVEFSPDSAHLLAKSELSTVIWNLATSPPISTTLYWPESLDDQIQAIDIRDDHRWLITTRGANNVRLWDTASSHPSSTPIIPSGPIILSGHEGSVSTVTVSPDSRWLVTTSDDGTARVWDLSMPSFQATPTVLPHPNNVGAKMSMSGDGRILVTAVQDAKVRIWDLSEGAPRTPSMTFDGPEAGISAISASTDGRWIAVADWDGVTQLWHLDEFDAAQPVYRSPQRSDALRAIAISPDTKWIVGGGNDGIVELWSFDDGHLADTPDIVLQCEKGIKSVAFSPDGKWLLAGSRDHAAYLWNVGLPNPDERRFAFTGHGDEVTAVDVSPDGSLIAIGSLDGRTSLWALTEEGPGEVLAFQEDHQDGVMAVTFASRDRLITGGGDGSVHVWSISGDEVSDVPLVLAEHSGPIKAATASPDGHWLVTSSADGAVLLWNLRIDDLVDLACLTAGRNLRFQEWAQYFGDQSYRPICPMLPAPADSTETESATPAAALVEEPGSTSGCQALFADVEHRKLAFVSYRDGNANIYVLEAGDQEPTQVTSYLGDDQIQTWLPDNRILFSSDRTRGYKFYTIGSDGTGIDFFAVQAPMGAENVSLSPDLARVAYTRGDRGNWDVFIDEERIDQSDAEEVFLVWSHQSDRLIVEYKWSGDRRQVWIFDSTRQSMLPFTNLDYAEWNASWAPDDEWIAFVSNRDNDPDIYRKRSDGSDLVPLTKNNVQDIIPIWSPNGQWLAFFQARGGKEYVCRVAADASRLHCLFPLPPANDSSKVGVIWTPDSRWICYSLGEDGQRDIFCRNVETESVCQLTNDPADDLNPSWSY